MRLPIQSWSNTLRRFGKKAVRKSREKAQRKVWHETLEPRQVMTAEVGLNLFYDPTGYDLSTTIEVYEIAARNQRISSGTDCVTCECSPVALNNDGTLDVPAAKTGLTGYQSRANPHPVVTVPVTLASNGPISTSPESLKATWTFDGSSTDVFYEDAGHNLAAGDTVMLSFQFDASLVPSGVYSWSLEVHCDYGSGTYFVKGKESGFVDVVNRLYSDPAETTPSTSEFGAGWFLPELDQLKHVNGSTYNLITGTNEIITINSYGGEFGHPEIKDFSHDGGAHENTLEYADGSKSVFDDDTGWIKRRIDRNGNERLYAYDDEGGDAAADELISITDGRSGRMMTFAYSGGLVASITDFAGETTYYEYDDDFADGAFRLTTVTQPDPDGVEDLASPITRYSYVDSGANEGLLASVIDPLSQVTTITYDHARRVDEIEQACGGTLYLDSYQSLSVIDLANVGASALDPVALVDVEIDADFREHKIDEGGRHTYLRRNQFGDIVEYEDALGNLTTYTYNDEGQVASIVQEDPDGVEGPLAELETIYTYHPYTFGGSNKFSTLEQIEYPDGTTERWEYADGTNWVTHYEDQLFRDTFYGHDEYGNVKTETHLVVGNLDDEFNLETDDIKTVYTYTRNVTNIHHGLLASVLDAEARLTTYDYSFNTGTDELTTTITYADGSVDDETTEVYRYNAMGNLIYKLDGLGRQTDYEYDALNRLVTMTAPDPDAGGPAARPVTTYRYDARGNQTHVTDALGNTMHNVFDTRGRPRQVVSPVADLTATPYADVDEPAGGTPKNGSWSAISRTGAISSDVYVTTSSGGDITFESTTLNDDKKYELLVRWVPSGTPDEYDTDALFEVFNGTSGTPLFSWETNLNIAPEGLPDGSGRMWMSLGAYSPDASTLQVVLSGNQKLVIDAVWVVEVGAVTDYTYNCVNNLVAVTDTLGNKTEYEYDARDQIVKVTEPDPDGGSPTNPVTHYRYDGFGRLVSVVNAEQGGTLYEYDEVGRVVAKHQVANSGLLGEYENLGGSVTDFPDYSSITFDVTRLDADVDFGPSSSNFAGITGLNNDFAARWSGAFLVEADGEVSFELAVGDHDGGRIYVNGVLIAEAISSGSPATDIGEIELTVGWHFIEIQYYDADGGDEIEVGYDPTGGTSFDPLDVAGVFHRLVTTRMAYTNAGEVETVTDPLGRTTTYDYDVRGRLEVITSPDPDGAGGDDPAQITYTYDNVGNKLTETDRLTHGTTYTYTDRNQLETVMNANGDDPTEYTYDLAGNLKTLTDGEGNTTTWVYDGLDRVIEETNELNATRYYQYDAVGNVTRMIDRNGRITRYEYDNRYRQTAETWQDETVNDKVISRNVFYDNYNGLDPDEAIALDANSLPKEAVVPGEYDIANIRGFINGLIIDIVGADLVNLDANDFEFMTAPTSDPTNWSPYSPTIDVNPREGEGDDGSDRIEITGLWVVDKWLRVTIKANSHTNLSTPDVFYFGTKPGDADGDGDVDGADQTAWSTHFPTSGGATWDMGDFDGDGWVTGADYIVWQTNFPFNPIEVDASINRTITYDYDALGQLLSVTDRDGNNVLAGADYAYTYDNLGRLSSETQSLKGLTPNVVFGHDMDALGRRVGLYSQINGTNDFFNAMAYDNLGRVTTKYQVANSGNSVAQKVVGFAYNDAGQLEIIGRYDGGNPTATSTTNYYYDGAGRLANLLHQRYNGAGYSIVTQYGYTWDEGNRLTGFSNSAHTGESATYGYDESGQLTGATYSGQDDEEYTYDDNGNRLTANGDDYTTGVNNRLENDDNYTYEYDGEGNITKRTDGDGDYRIFEWDHRNRLVSVSDYDDEETPLLKVSYTYDAFDRLIGRQVDQDIDGIDATEAYVYDGDQIVLRFADDDSSALEGSDLANRYLWGPGVDHLLAEENVTSLGSAGTVDWALGDHLNTIRDWVRFDGSETDLMDHAEYDSFGNRLDSPTVDSIFGWTGRIRDADTGLQWNGSTQGGGRWYDSSTGRWLSEDSIGFAGDASNLYRYVGNGATIFVDPSGLRDPDASLPYPAGGNGAPYTGPSTRSPKTKCPEKDTSIGGPRKAKPPRIIPPPDSYYKGTQKKILAISKKYGPNPTGNDLKKAIVEIDEILKRNSLDALSDIKTMRDKGTDNEMLAALDHYYNTRVAVEDSWAPGLQFFVAIGLNTGYSLLKNVNPNLVPRDNPRLPPSQQTWLQYSAGNFGAIHGVGGINSP